MIDEQKMALNVVAELSVKHQHYLAEATEALGHGHFGKWREYRATARKVEHARDELSRWTYEKAVMMATANKDPEAVEDFERLTTDYASHVLYIAYVDERVAEHDI